MDQVGRNRERNEDKVQDGVEKLDRGGYMCLICHVSNCSQSHTAVTTVLLTFITLWTNSVSRELLAFSLSS